MGDRTEEQMMDCPFCGEETLKVIRKERFKASKRGFGSNVKMKILGEPCNNCDAEKPEIKNKLKKKGYPL